MKQFLLIILCATFATLGNAQSSEKDFVHDEMVPNDNATVGEVPPSQMPKLRPSVRATTYPTTRRDTRYGSSRTATS